MYLDVTLSLELLDEHYHRSLIGVINRYHRSINKTYIWEIFPTSLVGQVIISGEPD